MVLQREYLREMKRLLSLDYCINQNGMYSMESKCCYHITKRLYWIEKYEMKILLKVIILLTKLNERDYTVLKNMK